MHAMSGSCALVPRAGAVRVPRASARVSSPRAIAVLAAPDGRRRAARLRHPLSAQCVAASRVGVGRWVAPRRAVAPRAHDSSRTETVGLSALSVEDTDEDEFTEPAVACEAMEERDDDPVTKTDVGTDDAELESAPLDEDGVPLDDDHGPCTTTEEGDEVCVLPFPFAPSPGVGTDEALVSDAPRIAEEETFATGMVASRSDLAKERTAAASTSGASPTDDARERRRTGEVGLWWRALKLPMYSVAAAPLTVAAAMTHHWFGCVNGSQFWRFLAGACLVIAWLNLSNDAWDSSTGVDGNEKGGKPESVVRLLGGDVAAVRKTHFAAAACLVAGFFFLVKAAAFCFVGASGTAPSTASGVAIHSARVAGTTSASAVRVAFGMLATSVSLGHAYQGPPFRFSYKGLGEPICFAAFGPLAVGAFYILLSAGVTGGSAWALPGQVGSDSLPLTALQLLSHPGVLGAACLVGLTTTSILFSSHLHQEDGDRAAGKLSPVVRLGVLKAVDWLRKGLIGHHVVALTLTLAGALPIMGCVGVLTASPLAVAIGVFAESKKTSPENLFTTKYLAVRWHIAHAVLLSAGCWLDPWMPWHVGRVAGIAVGVA